MSQPLPMHGQYPHRVLVADDVKSTRSFFAHLLGQRGIKANCCEDGWEAWQALQRHSFDVVITDLEMPRWSGIDLVRAMRKSANEGIRTTPVIVNSTVTTPVVVETVRSHRAAYYMRKPIVTAELDILLRMIATVQRRGRPESAVRE